MYAEHQCHIRIACNCVLGEREEFTRGRMTGSAAGGMQGWGEWERSIDGLGAESGIEETERQSHERSCTHAHARTPHACQGVGHTQHAYLHTRTHTRTHARTHARTVRSTHIKTYVVHFVRCRNPSSSVAGIGIGTALFRKIRFVQQFFGTAGFLVWYSSDLVHRFFFSMKLNSAEDKGE